MVEYGTHLIGMKKATTRLTSFAIGKTYEVNIKASSGISDPESVLECLAGRINEAYPELIVKWIKVCATKQIIDFQFQPVSAQTLGLEPRTERLFVGTLIAWLPTILTLLGIVVIGISVWDIIAAIPWYAWVLLGTGVLLVFFAPAITRLFEERRPTRKRD